MTDEENKGMAYGAVRERLVLYKKADSILLD